MAAPAASPQTAPGEAGAPSIAAADSAGPGNAPTGSAAPSSELTPTPTPALGEPLPAGPEQLQLVEATLSQLEQALATRLVTPAQLTEAYLARIAA
jgi:hypothetical protein